ncbi:hypothetical protein [Bremerella sp. P1]|uniref:hypothetical protein n=1 Tax=Bremerella sp. P1 TaxID=3026424 RepID=UPI002367B0AE|nr:hypothetical protein [Bremerella sp. P1]WDI42121.1 hypothetical protein PSR63_27080 [Bremerella sp. P1]
MDTCSEFYYYVTSMPAYDRQRLALRGLNFHSRFIWNLDDQLKRPLWGLNQEQKISLTSLVGEVHTKNGRWVITLPKAIEIDVPFLLCNDPNVRWVYSGSFSLLSEDIPIPELELADKPLPLVSHSWIGVAGDTESGLVLDAYSDTDIDLQQTYPAYSPEWDNSFEDEDIYSFQVSFP